MGQLGRLERAASLQLMSRQGVDVLVVGGGITGAGVALEAALRGYRVGLVEKADFASGTSSRSTKLVHGGLRYLAQFDLGLTHEALVERDILIKNAPFLVSPIGFVLPVYRGGRRPLNLPVAPPFGFGLRYMLGAGLLLYDLLAGSLRARRHKRIGAPRAMRLVPCLRGNGLLDAFVYYDAQTDDARLTITVIRTAAKHGALVANHAEVTGFEQNHGRITAARVYDHLSGNTLTINARIVVNATGVFAARVEELAGPSMLRIRPAKGVHLTVSREALKMTRHAVVLPETEDGRLLFVVPWGARVTVGTTDTEGGDIDHPRAEAEDVRYLLRHIHRYMRCQLKESDIISVWAGYRPLVSSLDSKVRSSQLSRTHAVLDGPGGMVSIVGGKLTTYRRMAQDTMDHVDSKLRGSRGSMQRPRSVQLTSRSLRLEGAESWKEALEQVRLEAPCMGLSADTVHRLKLYGSACKVILDLVRQEPQLAARIVPDLPYIMAEVVYACRYEMAVQLSDVLDRRLRISIEDRAHGTVAATRVAECMARELGWSASYTAGQVAAYIDFANSLSVRSVMANG
jgi:glycerol-3-phosphate dehydrogenase